jgi:hypothetical protein
MQRFGVITDTRDQHGTAQVDIDLICFKSISGAFSYYSHHTIILTAITPNTLNQCPSSLNTDRAYAIGGEYNPREPRA